MLTTLFATNGGEYTILFGDLSGIARDRRAAAGADDFRLSDVLQNGQ
jgi:hypothetical protein